MADQKLSNTRLNAAIVLCAVLHIAPHIILVCLHTPCSGADVDLMETKQYTKINIALHIFTVCV